MKYHTKVGDIQIQVTHRCMRHRWSGNTRVQVTHRCMTQMFKGYMGPDDTQVHDTDGQLIHESKWHTGVCDTDVQVIHGSRWHTGVCDTDDQVIHDSRWHTRTGDAYGYMIHGASWHTGPDDTENHMAHKSRWTPRCLTGDTLRCQHKTQVRLGRKAQKLAQLDAPGILVLSDNLDEFWATHVICYLIKRAGSQPRPTTAMVNTGEWQWWLRSLELMNWYHECSMGVFGGYVQERLCPWSTLYWMSLDDGLFRVG